MKMNIKRLLFLQLTVILILTSDIISNEKGNLCWKVTSETSTAYLLGSIHVGQADIYPLDTSLTSAFERSDYLAVELDPGNPNVSDILKKAYFTDDTKLKTVLKPEVYDALVEEFGKLNIKEKFFEKMKPWFAAMTLTNIKIMKSGFEGSLGIDNYFINKAKEKGIDIIELETAIFQITLFDSIMSDMQDDFVMYSLKETDEAQENIGFLFDVWKSGDLKQLEDYVKEQFDSIPNSLAFKKAFLDDRNINMTNKIEKFLESGNTHFVVVGAAHLAGHSGIINMLKETGKYKITKM